MANCRICNLPRVAKLNDGTGEPCIEITEPYPVTGVKDLARMSPMCESHRRADYDLWMAQNGGPRLRPRAR